MLKKVIGIAVILLLSLLLFGCVSPEVHPPDCGCNVCERKATEAEELAGYKVTEKAALESYAAGKGQDSYPAEDWIVIQTAVVDGKAAIDAAADKAGVDAARDTAKAAIDAVEPIKEIFGTFYSLSEAYDNGLITREDLKSLAYYRGWEAEEGFVPLLHIPKVLSPEVERAMKRDFVVYTKCTELEHNIQIYSCYGTYSGCVAAMISGCLEYFQGETGVEIDGIVFMYMTSQQLIVWKENE